MPFTFAHPAIILPLKKYQHYFSFSALVIGSLSPDFEYFYRFQIISTVGHTLFGVLALDLPLVILVNYLFHCIIKEPLMQNLPRIMQREFSDTLSTGWKINSLRSFAIFISSALIGISSHLFWDSFTHANGLFALTTTIASIPVYRILQHASTLAGFILIAFFLRASTKPRLTGSASYNNKFIYWGLVGVITTPLYRVMTQMLYTGAEGKNVTNYIVSLMSCVFVAVFLVSILTKIKNLPDKTVF